MKGNKLFTKVASAFLAFVIALSTVVAGNVVPAKAANVNPSDKQKTDGIVFEYYKKNQVNDDKVAEHVNYIKFTIDLVDENGNEIKDKAYDDALKVKGVQIPQHIVFTDNILTISASTFEAIQVPGYTFDDAYAFFYWAGSYKGEKKAVETFKNFGRISNGYSNYKSYIGFTSSQQGVGRDYIGDQEGYFAYNPTGTLRVVLKKVTKQNPYKTRYVVDGQDLDAVNDTVEGKGPNTKYYPTMTEKTAPVKEHKTFLGWSTVEGDKESIVKDSFFTTAVNSDVTLYAIYEDTKYTVTFNNYDGTEITSIKYVYGAEITVPAESDVKAKPSTASKNYTFAGWNETPGTTCAGDAEYIAQFSESDVNYEIEFVNGTASVDKKSDYTYGATVTVPKNPSYNGTKDIYTHTFKGWADENDVIVDFKNYEVVGNAVFHAVYTETVAVAYYKYNNKVDVTSEFYDQDSIKGRPSSDFKIVGSKIVYEKEANVELENILKDILAATATNTKPGTINGEALAKVVTLTKTDAQRSAVDCWYVLKLEGDGWHIDGGDYNTYSLTVNYVDTEGNVLKTPVEDARRVGTYTINAQDSQIVVNGRTYVLGEDASKEVVVTKEGAIVNFVFKKVFKIQAKLDYTLIVDHYADQKKGIDYIGLVVEGEDASAFLSDEALKNMETKYASWLDAGKKFSDAGFQITTKDVNVTELNKDVMIVAHRANIEYTVNFYDFNEELLNPNNNSYTYNEDVEVPEVAESFELDGYTYEFIGWDKDIDEKVTSSKNYYAQYESAAIDYKIVFNYKDEKGEAATSELIKNIGNEVTAPEAPSYEDDLYTYDFEKWTTVDEDGNTVDVEEIPEVTGDATYTAVYEKTLKQFNVTYTVDGILVDRVVVDAGSDVAAPLEKESTPKEGYKFSGWSTKTEADTVLADVAIEGTTSLIPAPVVVPEVEPDDDKVVPEKKAEVEADEEVIVKPVITITEDVKDTTKPAGGVETKEPVKTAEVEADTDVTTADGANMGLLISLLGLSVIAAGVVVLKRRQTLKSEE